MVWVDLFLKHYTRIIPSLTRWMLVHRNSIFAWGFQRAYKYAIIKITKNSRLPAAPIFTPTRLRLLKGPPDTFLSKNQLFFFIIFIIIFIIFIIFIFIFFQKPAILSTEGWITLSIRASNNRTLVIEKGNLRVKWFAQERRQKEADLAPFVEWLPKSRVPNAQTISLRVSRLPHAHIESSVKHCHKLLFFSIKIL